MKNNETLRCLAVAATLAASAAGASAQVAGTWFGGIGVTHVAPDVSSGN